MFVDASAIVGILKCEPEASGLVAALEASRGNLHCSSIARYEATVSLAVSRARQRGDEHVLPDDFEVATDLVGEFLTGIDAKDVDITLRIGDAAIHAARKYGRVAGHPAGLNMGDCFAYAFARTSGLPLLYKGGEFSQTDRAQGLARRHPMAPAKSDRQEGPGSG